MTLDPDVAALIEDERARTGESLREAINRLVRRGARGPAPEPVPLPRLPGRPVIDLADTSAALAALDEERRALRDLP